MATTRAARARTTHTTNLHKRTPVFRPLIRKEFITLGDHREYEECQRNREHLLWLVQTGLISATDAECNDRLPGEQHRPWVFGLSNLERFTAAERWVDEKQSRRDAKADDESESDVDLDALSTVTQYGGSEREEGDGSFGSETMDRKEEEPGFGENTGSSPKKPKNSAGAVTK